MDGSPLDQAYSAAKNADAAAMAGDATRASELFNEAALKFDEVVDSSPDNPAIPVLKALARQHRARAEYLSSGRAKQELRKMHSQMASGLSASSGTAASSAQAQLSAARSSPGQAALPQVQQGLPKGQLPGNFQASTNLGASSLGPTSPSTSVIAAPTGDALNNLMIKSTGVFKQTFEQQLGIRVFGAPNSSQVIGGVTSDPSESFYLVKPKAPASQAAAAKGKRQVPSTPLISRHNPPDTTELPGANDFEHIQGPTVTNAGAGAVAGASAQGSLIQQQVLIQTALDTAIKAQRQYLKTGLKQLKHDVALKEQQMQDEHTDTVDRLRAENDKLKVQVSKLKSRWDELKESARKRRGEV